MVPLAAIFQTLVGLLAIAIVLGFIAYGFTHGLFRSILVGMQALVALVVTLTFIPMLTDLLITIDMPPTFAFPIATLILAIGTAGGIHLLIEKYIPSESITLLSVLDKVGGAFVGGTTGYIAAGGFLIALTLMPLPEIYQINRDELQFDFGTPMLRTFARIIEPNRDKRNLLLNGTDWPTVGIENDTPQYPAKPMPQEPTDLAAGQAPPPLPPNIWSEPFVDLNLNKKRDNTEAYLEKFGDTYFTENALIGPSDLGTPDKDEPTYFVGILDRYEKNNWWRWRINRASWEDLYPFQNPDVPAVNPESEPNSPTEPNEPTDPNEPTE